MRAFSQYSAVLLLGLHVYSTMAQIQGKQVCQPPQAAPQKLERVISQCQEEIKLALLQEALQLLDDTREQAREALASRTKSLSRKVRDVFTGEERRIAGCLLQCVYRKMKAVDIAGLPTVNGLVRMYAEGVQDRNYYIATRTAVQQCLGEEEQRRSYNPGLIAGRGYTCDLAYDMFNCVSDRIEQFCGNSL